MLVAENIIITAIDLLALMSCIGIISFRVFVVPGHGVPGEFSQDSASTLWRTLGIVLALLTFSSIGWLVQRSLILSGRSLHELTHIVPIVVLKTHFGRVWLLRPAALVLLWCAWRATRFHARPAILGMMLAASAAIAATRTLSAHAADWGDFTAAELADWLHLLGVSVWGGSLIALTVTGFQDITRRADQRRQALAEMAARWSTLSGIALAIVVATGFYNAWRQVGSIEALWTTLYGRVLLTKLLLVIVIVMLGAANRYIGVPALRAWAGRFAPDIEPASPLAAARPYTAPFRKGNRSGVPPLREFTRRAAIEAVLMIGVVLCVAILTNLVPARHVSHMLHDHGNHIHGTMQEGAGNR